MEDAKVYEMLRALDTRLDDQLYGGTGPFVLKQAAFILLLGAEKTAIETVQRQRDLCLVNPGACVICGEAAVSEEGLEDFQERICGWLQKEMDTLSKNPGMVTNLKQLSFCLVLFPGVGRAQLDAVSSCVAKHEDFAVFEWLPFILLENGDPEASDRNRKQLAELSAWMQVQQHCLRCGILCSRDSNGIAVPWDSLLQVPLLTICLRTEPETRQHLEPCLALQTGDARCYYTARTAAITANRKLLTWQRMRVVLQKLMETGQGRDRGNDSKKLCANLYEEMDAYRRRLLAELPSKDSKVLTLPLWGLMLGGSDLKRRIEEFSRELYLEPVNEVRGNAERERNELCRKMTELCVRNLEPFYSWELLKEARFLGLELDYLPEAGSLVGPDTKNTVEGIRRALEKRLGSVCEDFLRSAIKNASQRFADAERWLELVEKELEQYIATQQQLYLSISLNAIAGQKWTWDPRAQTQKGAVARLKEAFFQLLTAPDQGEQTEEAFRELLFRCADCAAAEIETPEKFVQNCEDAFATPDIALEDANRIKAFCRAPVQLKAEAVAPEWSDVLLSPQKSNLLQNGWGSNDKAHAVNLECKKTEIRLVRYFYPLSETSLIV